MLCNTHRMAHAGCLLGASPTTVASAAAINGNGRETSHQEPATDAPPPVMLGGVVEREGKRPILYASDCMIVGPPRFDRSNNRRADSSIIHPTTVTCKPMPISSGLGKGSRGFPQAVHQNERRRRRQQQMMMMMGGAEGEGSSNSGRDDDEDYGVQGPSVPVAGGREEVSGGPSMEMEVRIAIGSPD